MGGEFGAAGTDLRDAVFSHIAALHCMAEIHGVLMNICAVAVIYSRRDLDCHV